MTTKDELLKPQKNSPLSIASGLMSHAIRWVAKGGHDFRDFVIQGEVEGDPTFRMILFFKASFQSADREMYCQISFNVNVVDVVDFDAVIAAKKSYIECQLNDLVLCEQERLADGAVENTKLCGSLEGAGH